MAQRTSQGVKDGGSALPSGTAQPALPRAEALGRCNPDQRAPSPALAKEDVLYATRPKPPAQLIRATRSHVVPDGSASARRRGARGETPRHARPAARLHRGAAHAARRLDAQRVCEGKRPSACMARQLSAPEQEDQGFESPLAKPAEPDNRR